MKQKHFNVLVHDEEDEGRMKADTIEEGVPDEDERIMISKKADTRLFKKFDGRVRMVRKIIWRIFNFKEIDGRNN